MVMVMVSVCAYISLRIYTLMSMCILLDCLSVQFMYWWISAGRVYISGWKHDQTDPCALYARPASAKTKLYHCMGVAMQISRIHGLYYVTCVCERYNISYIWISNVIQDTCIHSVFV